MAENDLEGNSADDRRARAERRLAATGVDLQSMPLEDVQNLVHELQVHQVELEIQNEELCRAQEEIEAARTKYGDLYESAPVGYFTLDRRGLILETNLTGARLLGLEKHRIIGTPFFLLVAPEDRKLLQSHLQKVFTSRVNQSCELKLTPREGVSIHLALESIAVDDREGGYPQCRTAVKDTTEGKQVEQEIARLASFPQLNPNPILEIDLTGAITFYNEAALKKVRELGLEDLRSLLPGDLDETIAAIRQKGEKGFCLEIQKADVVFSVLAHYTPQCQSIRLYYTDVTERKRAEWAMQESESRLRAIFEQAAVGVAEIETATGRFLRVNHKFCDIVGLSPEEMTATNFMTITPPEDLKVDLQYIQKLLNGQIRNFSREKRYRRQDGSVVWVNLTVSPMWKVGEAPSYHIAVVEDITARKQAEETLRLSEFKYHELFNNIRSAVAIYQVVSEGEDFVILEVNRAMEHIEQVKREDIVGRKLSEVFPGVKDFGLFGVLQRVWRTGIPEFFPVARYQDQRISGWRDNYVYQLPSGEIVAVYDDVTEEKQAEEALRRNYNLVERIMETSPVGITLLDRAGIITSANARAEEVLGLSRDRITARTYNDPQWRITDYDGKPVSETLLPFRQVMDNGRPVSEVSHAIEHLDGRRVLLTVNAAPLWDQEGQIEGVVATVEDVTERVNADRDLRQAHQEWEEIFQAIGHPTIILDAQHNIIMANRATLAAAGVSAAELQGKKCYEIFHGSDHPPESCPLEKMLISRELETVEVKVEALDGVSLVSCTPVMDEGGQVQKVIHIATDITGRKQAEEALKKSVATLKGIFKAAPIGIGLVKDRRFGWTNEQLSNITGYSAEELQGQSARLLYESDEEFARVGQVKYDQIRKSGTGNIETRFKGKDGSVRDILLSSTPLDLAQPTGEVIFTVLDITERKQGQEELYREKEKYRVLTEESPLGVAIIDSSGYYRYLNHKFVEIFGYTLADIPTGKDWFAKAFPDSLYRRQVMSIWMDDLREAKVGESRPRTFAAICKNGREKIIHFRPVTLGTQDQLIIYEDITERFRDEETLKSLIANAPIGIYIIQAGRFVLINPGFEAITGYRGQDLLGKDHLTLVTSEYKAIVRKKAIKVLKKADTSPYEYQFISKNGETGWVMETVIPTHYEGKRAVLGYFMDITAHKKLENQFLQAQRMEAVGRLAGGLAHDFNNVLAIIVIYVETILKEIHPGDPLSLHVKGIREASLRAISLTRQLMAVGRRQVLQPRAINLNALVGDMESMLRRLMGEDVELVLTLDQVETVAKVDPSQLEQVLLNLVVNARDAMPQGGKLTITITHTLLDKSDVSQHIDVTPGPYVVLAVSDTGIGMDQETQSHILEPFYTTKPSSEGTGLGLSSVYGIVKQSGGFMEVDSESGKGATFKIFLPTAQETFEAQAKITESPLLRGSETILLVEDVDELRQLLHDILKNNGYTVLTAEHGKEALLIGDQHQGPIHLLLLDVVLPQMSGGELAERLKSMYPGAKVLYMSGYPEDAIIHRKVLDGAAGFIQKPFSPIDLASKVREVLASSSKI